jgi:hypothetical protein
MNDETTAAALSSTIRISEVANGWIVTAEYDFTAVAASRDKTFVFSSFPGLVNWLDEYFTRTRLPRC